MITLLVDIGATKTRLAVAGRKIVRPKTVLTPQRWSDVLPAYRLALASVLKGKRVSRVIVGVPGSLDSRRRSILHATNLPNWQSHSLDKLFNTVTGAKNVRFENDADLAGLGEAVYGAGRGYTIVAYLGLGTGVGGTRIVHRQLDSAQRGFRPGHHIIDASSKIRCACGQYGDLEGMIGGRSLEKRYGRPAKNLSSSVYRQTAHYAGIGLNNLATLWSPEVIILGGAVVASLWPYRQVMLRELRYRTRPPRILRAQLGDIGGLYGALAVQRQR